MPARWIIRRDIFGRPEGQPLQCVYPKDSSTEPGLPSLNECVGKLMEADEVCVGDAEHRLVMCEGLVTGHIDVSAERPIE